jgi:ABC-type multidrug transport system fused ATPase/permease subunit
MNTRAQEYGASYTRLNMESLKIADETQVFSKEIHVTDRHEEFEVEFNKSRVQLSKMLSRIHFLPYVSKYAMEAVSIILLSGVALLQLGTIQDGKLYQSVIFLAALTRITPALMRIQQGVLSIRSHIGLAEETGRILLEAKQAIFKKEPHKGKISISNLDSGIELINVSYTYPNSESIAVKEINLTFPKGSISAIVGPSGSGKTTLVNLLLGLIRSTDGQVCIMGNEPDIAIKNTPGIIGYVPQVTVLRNDTVRANVKMNFEKGNFKDSEIFLALKKANLLGVIDKMPEGLDTKLGTDGIQLSGGELQRLGIARAVYNHPKILVLDEATSSLDGESEMLISELLVELSEEATIIFIAHRLSSLRIADQVILMEAGTVSDSGTLKKVLQRNERFRNLAVSMGLELK